MIEVICVIIQSNNSEVFLNIIVGTEWMRGCMTILTEYTNISEVINNGGGMHHYSMHLCCRNLEHSSRNRIAESLHDYYKRKYTYLSRK